MGKIEKLKCKLAENQEKVQKLEEELKQTRKQLKSANVSRAMSSKRRASKQGQRRTVRIVTLEDMRNQPSAQGGEDYVELDNDLTELVQGRSVPRIKLTQKLENELLSRCLDSLE
jgi:hypothetical protein